MAQPPPPRPFVDPVGSRLPVKPTQPSPTLDPGAAPVSEQFQLPPHQTKVERITDHVAALSADLREWTELRIALVQRKVEGVVGIVERLKHLEAAIVPGAIGAVLLIIGLLFVLVTLAIGLGALLGAYWAGFLIVTLVLLVAAGVALWVAYRRFNQAQAIEAQAKRERQDVESLSVSEIQAAQADHVRRSAA